MSTNFLRRSMLYTPASSMKMLEKSVTSTADSIIIDLEDAVCVDEKETARQNLCAMLPKFKSKTRETVIRVNAMDSIWGIDDILAIASYAPDAIILPKADEKAVIIADNMLNILEAKYKLEANSIKIIPLFETTYAIVHADSILASSPRIDGVQFGAEDLTREQEIKRSATGEEVFFARSQLAFAARSHGIDIIDTPCTEIRDLSVVKADSNTAKTIGFTGKTCIHPSHIETLNEVFSPSDEEVAYSNGVIEAMEAAFAEGKGAVMYQNKMIDAPVADRARRIIAKHNRIQNKIN